MSVSGLGKFLSWITKLLNSITVEGGVIGSNIQQRNNGHMDGTSVSCSPETGSVSLTTSDKAGILFFVTQGAVACLACPDTITCVADNPTGPEAACTQLVCNAATHNIHAVCLPECLFWNYKQRLCGSVYTGRTSRSRLSLWTKPDATKVSIVTISAASSPTPLLWSVPSINWSLRALSA